jgi:MFS family permease
VGGWFGGHPSSALEQANVQALTIDTAWQGVVQAGIGSFLAVFLVRLEAPNTLVGLVAALPALGAVLISVPASGWAAGWTNPVRVVNINRLLIRLTYLAIAAVPAVLLGLPAAYLVALFWGLASVPSAIANLAWTSVVAEIVPPARRPLINGTRWALLSIVTAATGAVFGLLLDRLPFPFNYQVVFVASFVAGVASLHTFGRIRMPGEGAPVPPRRVALGVLDLLRLVRTHGEFARFLITTFVYRLGLNLPVALFAIYWVTALNAPDTLIGLRTTAGYSALVISYIVWGYLAARRGHRLVLVAASAGLSLYPIVTALITDPIWLIPAALLWGLFASGIDVAFFETLLRTIPVNQRAVFIAINSSFANLAIFVAPLAGTLLADVVGLRPALITAGVLSLVGTVLMVALAVARATPADRPASQT